MFGKNVLKKLTMFVFILSMFIGSSINSYASNYYGFEGKVLGATPEEGWNRILLGKSELINYSGKWQLYSSDRYLKIQEKIEIDENGEKIYVGINPESKIEFEFEGKSLRILGVATTSQAVEYRVKIDDKIDEIIEIDIGNKNSFVYPMLFEILDLEDKKHKVTITPTKYNGEKFGGNYAISSFAYLAGIEIDGELSGNDDKINEEENVILDTEPEKEIIKIDEEVLVDLTINNIKEITAEDIRIKYDSDRLEFLGYEEVDGIKLVKDLQNDDELRVILASKGEANIINAKEILLKLRFRGEMAGEALVDVTKGRVTDGIEMEKDLEEKDCGKGIILIEEDELLDVNNSGEFTLLDLGIDARHLNKDPKSQELLVYNTDIVEDGSIDDMDLLEIGKLILDNDNYAPNNY